jgi:hypothetical protein
MDVIDVVCKEFLDNQYPELEDNVQGTKKTFRCGERKFGKQEIFLVLENLQLMSFLF